VVSAPKANLDNQDPGPFVVPSRLEEIDALANAPLPEPTIEDRARAVERARGDMWIDIIAGRELRVEVLNDLVSAAFEYGLAVGKQIGAFDFVLAKTTTGGK
jgi:hypothetical protein